MAQDTQLALFDDATSQTSAPWSGRNYWSRQTSQAAAEQIEPEISRLEGLVFAALAQPSTCDEVEQATGLCHQTTSARFRGLYLKGLIEPTEVKRPTRRKRMAVVWMQVGKSAER